jgi:hypothetical protein
MYGDDPIRGKLDTGLAMKVTNQTRMIYNSTPDPIRQLL